MRRWIPDCVHIRLILSVLWTVLIIPTVLGEIQLYDLWTNMSFCVENTTVLEQQKYSRKYIEDRCKELMNKQEDKNHMIEGSLYPDYSDPTNVTLNNITDGCLDETTISKCEAQETNTSCPSVKLCCKYVTKGIPKSIYSNCPSVTASTDGKCLLVTYQRSRTEKEKVNAAISGQPEVYHWTGSYIAKTISDTSIDLDSQEHETRSEEEEECIEQCLNSNWGCKKDDNLDFKMNNEILYIAYSPSDADGECNCSSAGKRSNCSWNRPDHISQNKTVYAVRYRDSHLKHFYRTKNCIAVIKSDSRLKYEVQNCSFHLNIICDLKHMEICSDYKGSHTTSTQQKDHYTTTAKDPAQGWKTERLLITFTVISLCVVAVVVILVVASIFFLKRKKHRERGRPNSISNRTYQIQNNSSEFEDQYATISEELQDTERPLLPPRNNVRQIGPQEVVFNNDYSTPSDSIAIETDVYTDTYDNPLRNFVQNCKDNIANCPEDMRLHETVALKPPDTMGKPCNTCSNTDSKDCEKINVMAANMQRLSSTDDTKSESVEITENAARRGSEYEIATITDTNDESIELSSPYFTLAKTNDVVNDEIANDNSHSDTPEKRENSQSTDADNCDYEDTSIIDGKFNQNLNIKSGTDGQELEHSNTGEKSLLCTISPVLLKQLNIKIVPDDNEYAVHYKNWPRSSSDEKALNAENDLNDITQCTCNDDRVPEAILHNNKNVEDGEYDKLCYVRRVVSAGKERNMYYHVVLKQEETATKSRARRASV